MPRPHRSTAQQDATNAIKSYQRTRAHAPVRTHPCTLLAQAAARVHQPREPIHAHVIDALQVAATRGLSQRDDAAAAVEAEGPAVEGVAAGAEAHDVVRCGGVAHAR